MSLSSISLKTAPTLSVTGGTALAVATQAEMGSALLVPTADTDFRTRRQFKFSAKDPRVNVSSPSGYTQQRSGMALIFPRTLSNGKITNDGAEVSLHWDVNATDAEKNAHLDILAQMFIDPAVRAALKSGQYQ